MNYTKGELPCGCYTDTTFNPENYTMVFCSKHKAAPDMYEALRKARANIGHIIMTKADAILVDEIDKALAEAEGK